MDSAASASGTSGRGNDRVEEKKMIVKRKGFVSMEAVADCSGMAI